MLSTGKPPWLYSLITPQVSPRQVLVSWYSLSPLLVGSRSGSQASRPLDPVETAPG